MKCLSYIVLVLLVTSSAQAQEVSREEAVATVIRHSRLQEQIDDIPEGFRQNMQRMNVAIDEAQRRQILSLGAAAFDTVALQRYVRRYLKEHYQAAPMQKTAQWLRAPLASDVRRRLRRDASPRVMQRFASRLQSDPPSEKRRRLIERLAEALHATERYVDTVLELQQAVKSAAETTSGQPVQSNSIPSRRLLRQGARSMTLMSLLYTFQDVSSEKLARYIDFYESKAGRWYVGTFNEAVRYALEQASSNLNARLEQQS